MFETLNLKGWRQFEEIDITFHKQLTILTGTNGAGKTTLLNILNRNFGWNVNLVGTPTRDKTGLLMFFSGIKDLLKKYLEGDQNELITIGRLQRTDGTTSDIRVSAKVGQTYTLDITNTSNVKGLHIPSHRSNYIYQQITQIPIQPPTREQIFSSHSGQVKNRYITGSATPPNYYIKESLIALAHGYGNEIISRDYRATQLFEGFQRILKIILPPNLGFEKISIEVSEVVLITKSGNFPIDSVSGGVASIIDLAWQVYMFGDPGENFIVTIDEPENHLHPEMQKTLLTNLITAFPNTQFIVSTHNPFIITSVPDSQVYVLSYNEENKVVSTLLDQINKAGSAGEVLREVLGLSSTKPEWVEKKLQNIISRYKGQDFNNNNLELFRTEMKEIGLDEFIPETVAKIGEVTQ